MQKQFTALLIPDAVIQCDGAMVTKKNKYCILLFFRCHGRPIEDTPDSTMEPDETDYTKKYLVPQECTQPTTHLGSETKTTLEKKNSEH